MSRKAGDMHIDKISFNNTNPKFGALKSLKYKGYYADSEMLQKKLTEALKQSKGVNEFFDKYDGSITFYAENSIGGLGSSRTDAIMKLNYRKNRFSPFPQKEELCFGTSRHNKFEEAADNLCEWLKQVSFNDFIRAIKYKM